MSHNIHKYQALAEFFAAFYVFEIFFPGSGTRNMCESTVKMRNKRKGVKQHLNVAKFNCDIRNKCVNLLYQHLVDAIFWCCLEWEKDEKLQHEKEHEMSEEGEMCARVCE